MGDGKKRETETEMQSETKRKISIRRPSFPGYKPVSLNTHN